MISWLKAMYRKKNAFGVCNHSFFFITNKYYSCFYCRYYSLQSLNFFKNHKLFLFDFSCGYYIDFCELGLALAVKFKLKATNVSNKLNPKKRKLEKIIIIVGFD